MKNEDYHVKQAYVLSSIREITTNGKITYIPIYDVMFLGAVDFMGGITLPQFGK